MSADPHLLRNPFLALAPDHDGYIAYDIERNRLHKLNAAASLIVELADGTRTAAAGTSSMKRISARIFARSQHEEPTHKEAQPRSYLMSKLLFSACITALVIALIGLMWAYQRIFG